MKNKKIFFAVIVFLLPLLMRAFWFYQGIYFDRSQFRDINFDGITEPLPEISANPAPHQIDGNLDKTVVLVDDAHHNYFDLVEIEALMSSLTVRNAEVLVARSRDEFMDWLKKADAILTIAPSEDFPNDEVEALEEFTQRGGRIVAFSDPTHPDSSYIRTRENAVEIINDMLQPFQISFNNDYLYNLEINEGNFRNIYVQPHKESGVTNGVEDLVFYGARSIDSGGMSAGVGLDHTFSSLTDTAGIYSPLSLDTSGNILAIGDINFLMSPFNEVADNYTLIENISKFMVNAPRSRSLKDWPYLFTEDVAIRFSDDIILDDELLSVISDLQNQLEQDDIALTLGSTDTEGTANQILLATYPPEGDLEDLLSGIGFAYPGANGVDTQNDPAANGTTEDEPAQTANASKNIIVPEFGEIPSKGFGFVLIDAGDESTRLILLADSQKNCVNLLRLLTAKNLDGCLAGNLTAVCDQDISPQAKVVRTPTPFSAENEPADELLEDLEDEPIPEPTPEETPEPTPSP